MGECQSPCRLGGPIPWLETSKRRYTSSRNHISCFRPQCNHYILILLERLEGFIFIEWCLPLVAWPLLRCLCPIETQLVTRHVRIDSRRQKRLVDQLPSRRKRPRLSANVLHTNLPNETEMVHCVRSLQLKHKSTNKFSIFIHEFKVHTHELWTFYPYQLCDSGFIGWTYCTPRSSVPREHRNSVLTYWIHSYNWSCVRWK